MNRTTHSCLLVLSILGLIGGFEQTSFSAAGDDSRAAIEAAEQKLVEAFNKGDAAAVAALYTEDAQSFPPESELIKGRKAIEQFWKKTLQPGITQIAKTLEAVDHGKFAHETGTYLLKDKAGAVIEEGKYFEIWKRDGGTWKVYREIWNVTRKTTEKK